MVQMILSYIHLSVMIDGGVEGKSTKVGHRSPASCQCTIGKNTRLFTLGKVECVSRGTERRRDPSSDDVSDDEDMCARQW